MSNSRKQYLYLEILRIIAILLVIFNHTDKRGFFLFAEYPWGSRHFWLYMAASIFCKLAVPLFLAISGALLLGKQDESIVDLYKHRVSRIIVVLVIYSFGYYIVSIYQNKEAFHLSEFFYKLWDENLNFSFWYLYLYIAFLISLPLLRILANNLEWKHFLYILCLYAFFKCILPIGQYLLWQGNHNLNTNLRVKWILSNIILYPLTGYYLHNHWREIISKGRHLAGLWALNIVTLMIACYMTYLRAVNMGVLTKSKSQEFFKNFDLLHMIVVYLTVVYLFDRYSDHIPEMILKIIQSMGACVFGIYLWHVFLLKNCHFTDRISNLITKQVGLDPMISAIAICLSVFLVAYLITWIQKKIPILNKLV